MPRFLSWVIVSGIAIGILSPSTGILNQLISYLGFQPIYFLGEDSYIRSVLIGSGIWRDSGYGTIIYLAALAGINPDLYEAAEVDGASRWRQTISITLPSLLPTIMILFLLHIGKFLDFGFERVYVFLNPLNSITVKFWIRTFINQACSHSSTATQQPSDCSNQLLVSY